MLQIHEVTKSEIINYLLTLTSKELEYYDIQNDKISETFIFARGAWDGEKLVGIGGLAVWYRCLVHLYFMVKQPYQGQGLGRQFAALNVEYARENNVPFLFGSAKLANVKSIKIVVNHGYEKVYDDGENYYSILLLNKKYAFVKFLLKIALPIYSTRIGKWIRLLKKIKRLGL